MISMKIRLLFFAVLRDVAGTESDELSLPEGTTARSVWNSLRESHAALAEYHQPPLTAINEAYSAPDTILRDGDELAFIPPVAGG